MFERWMELYKAALTGVAARQDLQTIYVHDYARRIADKAMEEVTRKEAEMQNGGYREKPAA